MTLQARDRLQELCMTRCARQFENMNVADVVAHIAEEHGFSPAIDIEGEPRSLLVQANETDFGFVTRLLEDLDAELWVGGDTFHATHHGNRPGATVNLRPQRDLFDIEIDADLTDQRSSIDISGWNVADKQAVSEAADANDIAGELDGLVSGGALLAVADTWGPDPDEHVVHRLAGSDATARELARSRYARMSRRFMRLSAHARGNAGLRVGTHVELTGSGLRFDGRYTIAHTRHTYDAGNGYRTAFSAFRSGIER
jgi:phage protein D